MNPEYMGEFLGTMFLVMFGLGVGANVLLRESKGKDAGWLTIATGWAMAALMGIFVAKAAGSLEADLNPAVTLAKYIMGTAYHSLSDVLQIMCVELFGAFCGAILVWLTYLAHWKITESPVIKHAVFCTTPAIRHWPSNLLTEMIATTVLVFGVGAIVSSTHPASSDFVPYLIAMLVWGIGLSLGGPTGYAINPARDLGPRLAYSILPIPQKGSSDWRYALVPIVGPLLGSVIGAYLWMTFFRA